MAYIGKEPTIGNFQVCDAISVVNGQAAYTMQVSSTNVSPETANHMMVSLNGILQKPGSSFTIAGSTITFASNLATGDVIDFIIILGNVLDLGTPSDGTVTNAKLAQDIISGETALTSTPADTDEFLVSDAGTLKRIDYSLIKGGGKVLQAVTATDTTNRSTTSTSFVTGSNTLSVDITPSATSSKILVILNGSCGINTQTGHSNRITVYRDSTNLGEANGFVNFNSYAASSTSGYVNGGWAISVLDSPSSTSELTYQMYFRSESSSYTATINNTTKGSITALEIGA